MLHFDYVMRKCYWTKLCQSDVDHPFHILHMIFNMIIGHVTGFLYRVTALYGFA